MWMWMTSCLEAMAEDFGIWKETVSRDLDLDEASWFSELPEARPLGVYEMHCVLVESVSWELTMYEWSA